MANSKYPRTRRRVLLDASSVILLTKAGLLENVIIAYRPVLAYTVYRELCRDGYPGAKEIAAFLRAGKISLLGESPVSIEKSVPPAPPSLGAGERETILHYFGRSGEFIVIDDGRGARYCRDAQVPFINALLVPKIFYFAGRFSRNACDAATDRVLNLGRYTDEIVFWAKNCTQNDLAFFMP